MGVVKRPTLPISEIHKIFTALKEDFNRAYEATGFRRPDTPQNAGTGGPRIPVNASMLHSRDLGNLLVEFRAWSEYVDERLLMEEWELERLKSEKDSIYGAIMTDQELGPSSDRAKTARATNGYIAIEAKVLVQKSRVGVVRKEAKRVSKDYAALSRIIELRLGMRNRGGSGEEDLIDGEDDDQE